MRSGAPTSRNRLSMRFAPFDLFWLIATPFVALAIREPRLLNWDDFPSPMPDPYQFALVTIACAIPAFLIFRLSEGMTRFFSVHDVFSVCAAVATTVATSSLFMFTMTRLDGIPRSTPLIYALVMGAGLVVARTSARFFGDQAPRTTADAVPDQLRNVILLGADRFSALVIKLTQSQKPQTTRVVAVLDDDAAHIGRSISGARVAGLIQDLDAIIDEYVVHGLTIDAVWISEQTIDLSDSALEEVGRICDQREIAFAGVAEHFNLIPKTNAAAQVAMQREVGERIQLPQYFKFKRVTDICVSTILLVLFAPLWVVVSCLVLFDVGSPVLFWQERIGRGGRRFLVHKYRTYRAPFDWQGAPVADEERLSKLGRFIRATRFDELPQLLNILVGDMSLIGPRPLLPHDQPADPTIRLQARPGITGWAQANGGNLVTPEEKDALDEYYIRNASLRLDLKIVWLTLKVLFVGERRNATALAKAQDVRTGVLVAPTE